MDIKPILQFPCYEPAGKVITITEADLVQHVLLLGSTGSGKSSLLVSAIKQLTAHESRPGLLILDAKADDLVVRVREAAEHANRLDDLLLFGPGGQQALNLFGSLHTLADVERVTRSVLLGSEPLGQENAYWQQAAESMLLAAFTLVVVSGHHTAFPEVLHFLRQWFFSPHTPPAVENCVRRLENMDGKRPTPLAANALDQIRLWQTLDQRTRSNLQSCLVNILRPLLSPAAVGCFHGGSVAPATPALAASGKIAVMSVNALAEPDLARFLFRLAKQQFFDAVQQRPLDDRRLTGLIADEWPLVVTPNDVEQLATVRSRNCFVLAATQSLLTERLGISPSRALLNNFNTQIYLRSRDAEIASHAYLALGLRTKQWRWRSRRESWLPPEPLILESVVPVCPMGALARLAPHQAFVLFADGTCTPEPVWLAPWFELQAASASVPASSPAEPASPFSVRHTANVMAQAGYQRQSRPEMLETIWNQDRRGFRQQLLEKNRDFFRSYCAMIPQGLETLPTPWLAGLSKILWATRKPEWTHLPYFLKRVSCESGMLLLQFAQELPNPEGRLTAWDRLRITVNASLYPSLWRPLKRHHLLRPRLLPPAENINL